jgi:hypothetical protein
VYVNEQLVGVMAAERQAQAAAHNRAARLQTARRLERRAETAARRAEAASRRADRAVRRASRARLAVR